MAGVQPDITPDVLENASFTTRMRGYDPEEVDALLAAVATQLHTYKDAADRAYQLVGEEMGELLQKARDRADEMMAAAEKEAAEALARARAEAERERAEASEETRRVRDEAHAAAAEMRAHAEQEASAALGAAHDEAERMRGEAAEAANQMRSMAQREADERIERADERVRRLEEKEVDARARVASLHHQLVTVAAELEMLNTESAVAGDETGAVPGAVAAAPDITLGPPSEDRAEATS